MKRGAALVFLFGSRGHFITTTFKKKSFVARSLDRIAPFEMSRKCCFIDSFISGSLYDDLK